MEINPGLYLTTIPSNSREVLITIKMLSPTTVHISKVYSTVLWTHPANAVLSSPVV